MGPGSSPLGISVFEIQPVKRSKKETQVLHSRHLARGTQVDSKDSTSDLRLHEKAPHRPCLHSLAAVRKSFMTSKIRGSWAGRSCNSGLCHELNALVRAAGLRERGGAITDIPSSMSGEPSWTAPATSFGGLHRCKGHHPQPKYPP
jgi:hypothetical protein